jgi:hypothetical protein
LDAVLSAQILAAIFALDCSNNCHPVCDVCDAAGPLAGCAHSVELFGFRSERRGSAASGHRDGDTVVSRVYVWLFAGRTSDRKRAADAPDHRHDLLRNNVVRYTVGLFIFTFLFSLGVQNRLETKVYQLPLIIAAVLALLCFAAFLYLIDYAARLLRPISILTQVGNVGLGVIESVYPDLSLGPGMPPSQRQKFGPPAQVIYHRGTSGIILAANLETLKAAAETASRRLRCCG